MHKATSFWKLHISEKFEVLWNAARVWAYKHSVDGQVSLWGLVLFCLAKYMYNLIISLIYLLMTSLLVSVKFNVIVSGSGRNTKETNESVFNSKLSWEQFFARESCKFSSVCFVSRQQYGETFFCTYQYVLFNNTSSIFMKHIQCGQQLLNLPYFLHQNSTLEPPLLSFEWKPILEDC